MKPLLLVLLAGCVPRIERGPAPVVQAQAGPRLVEMRDDTSPNVYFQASVLAGSAYDPIGQEGLAGLTARSMLEGGAGEMDAAAFRKALFLTGNTVDLVADRHTVTFRLTCHADLAEKCLDLFANVLVRPRLEESEVTRLRDEAVYEVSEGVLSDEEALGQELLTTWLYEAHPYGHPVAGRSGVLPLLTVVDTRTFHQRHYVREAVVAGIGGHYDDGLREAFRTQLAGLPAARSPELALQKPLPTTGRSLLVADTETPVTGFHFGHPLALRRGDPDWPALYVATVALGLHRESSGRLYRSLRTARGLNYGDYAYVEAYRQRGYDRAQEQGALWAQPLFYVWLRPTSIENGPFALKLAIAEVEQWVEHGLTAEELDDTKRYVVGHLPLEATDPGRRLAYAVESAVLGQPDPQATLKERVSSLTVEQVNAAIKTWIHPENLRIVAVSGEAEDLLKRLLEESPTPIVYADVAPAPDQASRDTEIASFRIGVPSEAARVLPSEGLFR